MAKFDAFLDEAKKILAEKVVKKLAADIEEQEQKLKDLNKGPGVTPATFELSERFLQNLIDVALSQAVVAELKEKLEQVVLTGRGSTRRNPAAVA